MIFGGKKMGVIALFVAQQRCCDPIAGIWFELVKVCRLNKSVTESGQMAHGFVDSTAFIERIGEVYWRRCLTSQTDAYRTDCRQAYAWPCRIRAARCRPQPIT